MKQVWKWQFLSLMDHSIICIQICPKFPLYSKWAKIKLILETSTFYVPKMKICKWNWPYCIFTQTNPKRSSISKSANLKLAKWVELKSASLKFCKWMFWNPLLPSFNVGQWTTSAGRDWIFYYSAELLNSEILK